MRYLKGTMNKKLIYERNYNFENILSGYADADWGGLSGSDRKSTSGYILKMFDSCTIGWKTKKQTEVAGSTTEAEYISLAEAVKEITWIKQLLKTIDIKIDRPIPLYEDNEGCINIANNPYCQSRSKSIDIKYHITREKVENKTIAILYIPTGNQQADINTKALPGPKFVELAREIGVRDADE